MTETCVSFVGTAATRCPNESKTGGVFCETHSKQYLAKYLLYKKLESNLSEVQDNRSIEYYLRQYSRFSQAHKVRFNFRAQAIAYTARDIGHQMRLDWLLEQADRCVQNLHRIFTQNSEKTTQAEKPPSKVTVTQAERVAARKVFKAYTATKKKVEDYDALIKDAKQSDIQNVEGIISGFHEDIRNLWGSDGLTTMQLIEIGKCMANFIIGFDFKADYGTQAEILVTLFSDHYTLPQRLKFASIGHALAVGNYRTFKAGLENTSVSDNSNVQPDATTSLTNLFTDNCRLLKDVADYLSKTGLIVCISSKLLRLIYNTTFANLIYGDKIVPVYVSNMAQVAKFQRAMYGVPLHGLVFTVDQLNLYRLDSFIEQKGNIDQLIAWRDENISAQFPDPSEVVSIRNESFVEAVLITEYYTQALALKLSRIKYIDQPQIFSDVDSIRHEMEVLSSTFAFPELVALFQEFRDSGKFRDEFTDIILSGAW